MTEGKITFNRDHKFDIQLNRARIHENRLAKILNSAKIELKTETWQWEQTGNIAIEFSCDGKPSGIATTEADFWVHELCRGDETLLYLMFPIERLKELCREAYRQGHHRRGGDDNRFEMILLPLKNLLAYCPGAPLRHSPVLDQQRDRSRDVKAHHPN